MTVFSQISWQGGICNDEYLADSTQFSHCEDVNIYESSGYFKLGPEQTVTTLSDGQDYRCEFSIGNKSYIAGGNQAGTEGIFAVKGSPSSYLTTSGKNPITGVGVVRTSGSSTITGKGFIITNQGALYYWDYDSSALYGNFTDVGLTNVVTAGTTETRYTPFVIKGSKNMYYAYLNKVHCIDTVSWVEIASASGTTPILTLNSIYTITNLFIQGNSIIIYANDGVNTKKYFWDGSSENISEIIELKGKKIINVSNFGNYELVQYSSSRFDTNTGSMIPNQYSVGILEGYDLKPLYSSNYPANTSYTSARGFQTITSQGSRDTTNGDNLISFGVNSDSLAILGNFKPGKPLGLSFLSKNASGTIGLIDGDGFSNTVYAFTGSLGKQTIYGANSYESNGYVITNPIRGRAVSLKKSAKKVMYGYELQTGSTIKVYYQFDKNSEETLETLNWTLLDTITVGTDFPDGMGYRVINLDGKFNIARFKIQLETSNSSYSPKLFDFHFEYDETNAEL